MSVELSAEHLAHFQTPKTWPEILALTPRLSSPKWRHGIIEADDQGSGLLTWIRAKAPRGSSERRSRRGAWTLTDKGREYIAQALESRA